MSRIINLVKHPGIRGGIATIVVGAVLLAFPFTAVAQTISDTCGSTGCHNANYQDWKASGHPYKFMKAEIAQNRPIPLPEGYTWDEISYVIGGYKWKSRYVDLNGYIITQDKSPEGGNTQYNYLTGEWVDYHADQENGTREYGTCGTCHTTNWVTNPDPTDLSGNQDGLAGIWGTFDQGGIQCIQCHGTDHPGTIDSSAEACGNCHFRDFPPGGENGIPASGGWIKHHEQYNEFMASGDMSHFMECTSCHDPHKRAEFSIVQTCEDCHADEAASFATNTMFDYGVECTDCHMPMATKSGQVTAPHQGDVMTHIFRINTDPEGKMFTEDGSLVALNDDGEAAVTMDFACQKCHLTASLDELALYAEDFHNPNKTLADIGLDPGLTGTWWKASRSGEGILLEVSIGSDGNMFMFASFYTFGPDGEQVWLTAQLTSQDGTTANVVVLMPEGGAWGDDFVEGSVNAVEWGSGTFTFPTCGSGAFDITPNQAMMDLGFTNLAYDLTRTLDSGIACPTFVNNEMAAAAGN
jgi:hypothetical protein